MAAKYRILIVDDDKWSLKYGKEILEQKKYLVHTACGGIEGVELIKRSIYDLVITDMVMPEYSGIEVLKIAVSMDYKPVVIMMTGYGTIETAVEAMQLGAFNYIQKPLDTEQSLQTIASALKLAEHKKKTAAYEILDNEIADYKKIISQSLVMKDVIGIMDLVSASDVSVLVEGESGTGKELVARYIHYKGPREGKPFVAVNCSAFPESLLESELFGHTKGSFTGSIKDKKGLFEEADGGTFLLDEIGDMPVNLQAKLLRFLQNGEVRKVGSTISKKIDVRIISSTNKNLPSLIKEGNFREDLFYRLKVVPIKLPPLRDRTGDINLLLDYFLDKAGRRFKKNVVGFSTEAITMLNNYHWPGNIRELEHLVEGVVVLTHSLVITTAEIEMLLYIPKTNIRKNISSPVNLNLDLNVDNNINMKKKFSIAEKNYILNVLKENNWNQVKTAKDLGIGRTTLWRKINAMDLQKKL